MTTSQLLVTTAHSVTDAARYSLLVAREQTEVRAAQRLRHQVFAGELGAVLRTPEPGLDVDHFDPHCDHLVVREDRTGQIVGTYRMLSPEGARRAGGLYCETEFVVPGLESLRDVMVETGRSCVHPDHRTGAVVSLVWAGIARYMLLTGYRWLVGCASVPLHTPGAAYGAVAAGVWDGWCLGHCADRHFAPEQYRVTPRRPWDTDTAPRPQRVKIPPLLRGYLRLNAWVCGPPAHDPDFGVADFLVLLCLDARCCSPAAAPGRPRPGAGRRAPGPVEDHRREPICRPRCGCARGEQSRVLAGPGRPQRGATAARRGEK